MTLRQVYWRMLVDVVGCVTEMGDLWEFMIENGRVPHLEKDAEAPWAYRGWLLPVVVDLVPGPVFAPPDRKTRSDREPAPHGPEIGTTSGRWGYWARIVATQSLPDPPQPPRLSFGDVQHGSAASSNLMKCHDRLRERTGWSAVHDLTDWLAWGLAVSDEPANIPEAECEFLYRNLCLDYWLAQPADYLGWLRCETKGRGKDPTAFFPTPQSVVQAMCEMMFSDWDGDVLKSANDPCIGTGRTVIAASNYLLDLTGQDINPWCVKATLVNGAIWAPWLSFRLPIEKLKENRDGRSGT